MENASKALIIAGAILIAILLISVGILVMNSINKPLDEASNQAVSQAAQLFNSNFTSYVGKDKNAQSVKALCNVIISSNASDANHQVKIKYKESTVEDKDASEIIGSVKSNKRYTINAVYAYTDGTATKADMTSVTGASTITIPTTHKTEAGYVCYIEIKQQ